MQSNNDNNNSATLKIKLSKQGKTINHILSDQEKEAFANVLKQQLIEMQNQILDYKKQNDLDNYNKMKSLFRLKKQTYKALTNKIH